MADGRLHIPEACGLPLQPETQVPYVFVADDAFPLGRHLLKPFALQGLSYAQRVFNYRLSRARRISENVFGILASRFRIFLGAIHMLPKSAKLVILAAVTIHNFLRARNPYRYIPAAAVDQDNSDGTIRRGDWRQVPQQMVQLDVCSSRNPTVAAKNVRQTFTHYFNTVGAVPWQGRVLQINRHRTTMN